MIAACENALESLDDATLSIAESFREHIPSDHEARHIVVALQLVRQARANIVEASAKAPEADENGGAS